MTFLRPSLKSERALLESALEVSTIEASAYFASLSLGISWYNYEDLKEISDLRRTTTVIGYLPIHLLVLLATDVADIKLAA